MKLSGWGNYPYTETRVHSLAHFRQQQPHMERAIARGMGRSYGDSSLAPDVIDMQSHDRLIAFDKQAGVIHVQAGVLLADLVQVIVPQGWFVPVTPGTWFVTIGGMVASDVHGKNHHCSGSFGRHVLSMKMLLADGSEVVCSPQENSELFYATQGGMGLTGVILEVSFKLIPIESGYIRQQSVRVKNIHEAMQVFEETEEQDWTYSVAWIDCLAKGDNLGRSIIMRGEHALPRELPAGKQTRPLDISLKRKQRVPFFLPGFALNGLTVSLFNALYYRKVRKGVSEQLVDYQTFFYPLDAILDWNRIYGKKGFVQHQFVIPKAVSAELMPRILDKIANAKNASFLAVLKLFGEGDKGPLSFPMRGYTLALDFPASNRTFALLEEIDELVHQHGGRIYLTKDARMQSSRMQQGYARVDDFRQLKQQLDHKQQFCSDQAERLGIFRSGQKD